MKLSRRQFIQAGAAAGAATIVGGCDWLSPKPTQTPGRALIAPAAKYGPGLVETIVSGLREFADLPIKGKSILLKPNLVETTTSDRPINTHPQVVVATAEAFRKLGARRVVV